MKKIIAGLATALLAFGFAGVAGIAPASAQTPSVSGSAACQADGTYTVTWNYSVSGVAEGVTATASVTASSPASSISGGGTTTTGTSFTQSGIAGSAAAASVTIQTLWSDGLSESTPASLPLAAGCVAAAAPAPVADPAPETDPGPEVVAEAPPVETPATTGPDTAGDTPTDTTAEAPTDEAPADAPAESGTAADSDVPSDDPADVPADDSSDGAEPLSSDTGAAGAARGGQQDCITDDEVSYIYDPVTNSGTVTVGTNAGARGQELSGELCEPLYVTATSWTFMATDDVWPVALDVVNPLEVITEAGVYEFGAPVTCGKGIIYASHEPIEPPVEVLEGPDTPQTSWLEDLFPGFGPSWTYNKDACEVDVELVAALAFPQICDPDDPTTPLDGQIIFLLNDAVTYAVDGVDVTEEVLTVDPGTYTVTIRANPGYTYIGETETEVVIEAADCELPVFAVWDANASAVSEQCPPSGTTPISGYITVVFPEGAEDAVQYFIGDTELTSSRTEVDPGTYTVTAVPRVPEDSILGDTSWTLTVDDVECAVVLAQTGTDSGSGLALGAGLLMLGGTLMLMRRSRQPDNT